MTLQALARSALAHAKTAVPSAVVAVVYEGRTANGMRDSERAEASGDIYGESGLTTSTVRVDASELGEPTRGAAITVDGVACIVTECRRDPALALLAIVYQEQRPVEGL